MPKTTFKLILVIVIFLFGCNSDGAEQIVNTPTPVSTVVSIVEATATRSNSEATATRIIEPSATQVLQSLLETSFPTQGIVPSSTRTSLSISPTVTPTPDFQATNSASFLIVNATPFIETIEEVVVVLEPSQDLQDMVFTIQRGQQSPQTLSIARILFGEAGGGAISRVNLIALRDIDLLGDIEAVFAIDTYGASCCTVHFVVFFNQTTNQYEATNIIWRRWRHAAQFVDIDGGGQPELVTVNTGFNELQVGGGDSLTDSISPLQILRFSQGRLLDVTVEYPTLMEADAKFWLSTVTGVETPISDEYVQLTRTELEFWQSLDLCGVESFAFSAYMANMIQLNRASEACNEIESFYESTDKDVCQNVIDSYSESEDFCLDYTTTVNEWFRLSLANP